MSEIINMGWLTDNNGNKFAPKTLITQVQTVDGTLLDNKLESDMNLLRDELKAYADDVASGQVSADHNHDDKYYTEAELDAKFDEVDESISGITSGSITVAKAEQATNADKATLADNATRATIADTATTAGSATKATQDASGNVIVDIYETKSDALAKLEQAKSYADTAATNVKNDLLNGAGEAYDTLQELGLLIDENHDAIDALETIATNKADKDHTHDDRYYTESEIETKLSAKSDTTHTHNDIYYTKSEFDSLELITVEDIDIICGGSIQMASEVMF